MRLVVRHRQHAHRLIASRLRLLFGQPGSAARKPRELDHASPQNARIRHIPAAQRQREGASLHVGGGTHGRPLPLPCETVLHHGAVARRVDVRHVRRHPVIHQYRSLTHFDSGILQKARVRADTDGENHHVRRKQPLVRLHPFRSHVPGHTLQLRGRHHFDAFLRQMAHRISRHLCIKSRHDLGRHINQRHRKPFFQQILRHFQSDETAAHYHGALYVVTRYVIPRLDGVVRRAHHENARQI